jgi:hypothetical protein
MFDEKDEAEKPAVFKNENSEITFEEQEFFNWCDANEIDRAVDGMDEDERKSFDKMKRHFTDAVKEKRIVIDGDSFTYTVSKRSPNAGKKFNVTRPNGRAMLAMDGYKQTQENQKLQAFMAAITRTDKRNIADIAGLDKKDYQVLQDICILFLTA